MAQLKNKRVLGSLCKRGHDYQSTGKSVRYKSGACVDCETKRKQTPELKARAAIYRKTHKYKASVAKYWASEKGKESRRRESRKYRARNPTMNALRTRFLEFMRGTKTQRSFRYGVDYKAIVDHIGSCPGPRKEWHIDHIIPLASFDHTDPEQIRRAWAPENHQWLPATENQQKGASLDWVKRNG